jgi:hypothetical protein
MVAISSELVADFDLETGLPQSEQKRTSEASSVPQKEQYGMEFPATG